MGAAQTPVTRRLALALGASVIAVPALSQGSGGRVIVVGGGFGGATCARALKRLAPRIDVILIEANATFTACPFSNLVIAGLRELSAQQFGYDAIVRAGVKLVQQQATDVDAKARTVTLADGSVLPYDRLVLSPGVDIRWDGLPGYTEDAAARMPHAWKAGAQTMLLRQQLEAMEDGGAVVMSVPANPYRCPPGPYERASLIAYYLKTKKPKSKLIVLDAKDAFSKQRLFQNAWKELYPAHPKWISLSAGGKVNAVDPRPMTLKTDFASHKADVANVIPPQKAGAIAAIAGVTDKSGWCPVEPFSFTSTLQPDIHVIGDAAIMGAMPKSAFSASVQAKVCAAAIVKIMAGASPAEPRLINTCYSVVAPDYGITVAGVYKPGNGQLIEVAGSGGTSPIEAPHLNAQPRRLMPMAGSRPSAPMSLVKPLVAITLAFCGPPAAAQAQVAYEVKGDEIPRSLTSASGDAKNGLALAGNRQTGLCVLCHAGPFADQRFMGTLAPDLRGAGARWSEGQFRLRLVDPARFNAGTIMPAYYRTQGLTRVAPAFSGKTILNAQQIEDIVAWLATLRD